MSRVGDFGYRSAASQSGRCANCGMRLEMRNWGTHLADGHNAACGGLDHAGDDFGSHGGGCRTRLLSWCK